MKKALVTGAGGFIGHHLVKRLKSEGYWVMGADLKYPEFEMLWSDDFWDIDLRHAENCWLVLGRTQFDEVYHLAADMGGIGYITNNLADLVHNNVRINTNMLQACKEAKVGKFFFSSSACVYAQNKQKLEYGISLSEEDAYPADPEPGYGWEKLFMEQMCKYYQKDFGMNIRIARFHNVYGPLGTYNGGKEKAPAAICRKIAGVKSGDTIEIWGDGQQTRSFMYIDDCIEGIRRIMQSDYDRPLNLGTEEIVTISWLAHMIASIAGKQIEVIYDRKAPQGVRGRNSDNTRIRKVLGWEPSIPLEKGIAETYRWIESQIGGLNDKIKENKCTTQKLQSVVDAATEHLPK